MGSFSGLLILSVGMFIGSIAFGYIPILLLGNNPGISRVSLQRLRYANALGAGLFVGTAFSIIIPEGATLLLTSQTDSHADLSKTQHSAESALEEPRHIHCSLPSAFGIPICLGFVAMMIIERISASTHSHGSPPSRPSREHERSHSEVELLPVQSSDPAVGQSVFRDSDTGHSHEVANRLSSAGATRTASSAFIGLLVHCAADGVALGSVALSERARLEMLVFTALMMHKGPAAFGLTAFLLQQKQELKNIWRLLIAFATVAPVAAIITYVVFVDSSAGVWLSGSHLGNLMLFSAGTFLFVACVHILPEISSGHQVVKWSLLATVCLGTLIPSILESGAHQH